jgi:hypothetical protein
MRKSEKGAGRLGPASLGRKRPGRAHPRPYVGPRMLRTPREAANRLLIGSVAHRHWNASGKRHCPGVLAQFFRAHREQFFHFRCPRGCWWRKRRTATARQEASAIAALEPRRCEGLARSWDMLANPWAGALMPPRPGQAVERSDPCSTTRPSQFPAPCRACSARCRPICMISTAFTRPLVPCSISIASLGLAPRWPFRSRVTVLTGFPIRDARALGVSPVSEK